MLGAGCNELEDRDRDEENDDLDALEDKDRDEEGAGLHEEDTGTDIGLLSDSNLPTLDFCCAELYEIEPQKKKKKKKV
jgi:midasin (ATPase involved in ribosome maturation)